MSSEYKDWLGQPIEVGSPVLYAISEGHFAKVVWGEVLEIIPVEHPEPYFGGYRNFKLKVQSHYENIDVLGNTRGSSARSVDYKREWNEDKSDYKLVYQRVLPKPSFVKNVEKVTVFPLPEGVRQRFEEILDASVIANNERVESYRIQHETEAARDA